MINKEMAKDVNFQEEIRAQAWTSVRRRLGLEGRLSSPLGAVGWLGDCLRRYKILELDN